MTARHSPLFTLRSGQSGLGIYTSQRDAAGLKHIRTRPYTPRTIGKAERFIQTLCKEWAYAMAFQNSQELDHWLPQYLSLYNRLRKHSAWLTDTSHPRESRDSQLWLWRVMRS
jgi:transposase InsO family protein